jgi:hypothetical protein
MIKKSISPAKAADLLDLSVRSIYRMAAGGLFVCFKARGSLRITIDSLTRYQELQIANFNESQGILATDDDM